MKSFVTSTVLHTVILTWGLLSFSQPRTLDMTQGESLPVSIVPIEEFSQVVQGAREAELTDAPAPEPTQTPETLPMPAENAGDNEVDLASPPRPETAPREVVQTATSEAPPPPPEPQPAPEPEPAPEAAPQPEPVPEPTPEPTPEPAAEPEQAEPAPAPEPIIDEAAPEMAEAPAEPQPEPEPATPRNVPAPQARPTPPVRRAETPPAPPAETQPQRQPETPREPEREVADSQAEQEPEFDADEIAALLNREESAGGGAQRSDQQAALGGTRTTGESLSLTELDALRGQIQRCWSPPAGVADAGSLRISIQMELDPSGALTGMPQVVAGAGGSMAERAAGEAAVRAVRRCAPYNLPIEKYDTWSRIQINFDPSQMF